MDVLCVTQITQINEDHTDYDYFFHKKKVRFRKKASESIAIIANYITGHDYPETAKKFADKLYTYIFVYHVENKTVVIYNVIPGKTNPESWEI